MEGIKRSLGANSFTGLIIARCFVLLAALTFIAIGAFAREPMTKYFEGARREYCLPDPLLRRDGEVVTNAETWHEKRRPEVLELFRTTSMAGLRAGRRG